MANCIKKIINIINKLKSKPQDAITAEWDIYKKLVNDLGRLYMGNGGNSENSVLHVGLFDKNFIAAFDTTIRNGDFVSNLRNEIHKELGIQFADVKVYTTEDGFPQQRNNIPEHTGCYYIVLPKAVQVFTTNAQLRIVRDKGKLLQDSYTISPTDGVKRWNIGRGENVDGAYFRQNHIVFEDDSTNDCNKYVSRAHAHIKFDNAFMLFVDSGGRKCEGNRTRILRDDECIDLGSNMNVPVQLSDGDCIELGKHAMLEFRMI